MANNENLIPFTQRSKEEVREMNSRGGKASGRTRRRKKRFREELEALLPLDDLNKNGEPLINQVTGKKQTIQQTITMQWLLKARKGDIKAIKLILETLGERLLRTEETHDVTVRHSRYDGMTDEELKAENERLNDCINNL